MNWRRLAVCVFLLAPGWALADDKPVPSAETIQALMDRIARLEKRVAELEGGTARAVIPTAVAPQQPPPQQHAEHVVQGPAADATAPPTFPSMKMTGFTDLNFASTNRPGATQGFYEGQFVLHVSSSLSSKVSYFGEVSMSARADAGTGMPPATGFNVEVERSIIRFDQSDALKFSIGRYHTPINYWNTAFHHGQWLQTSVARPEMTQFGGRFIPVHFIGGLVEGAAPAGGMNLNYNVGLGNGRDTIISRGGDAGDPNHSRAWLVNLFVKPDKLYGLQVGGSVYRDKVSLTGNRDFREWISSAHLVWHKENPELIAEFANVHHTAVNSNHAFNSQAWYVQTGYRLPWFDKLWKPYYRFEYIHIPRTDAVLAGVASLAGSVAGLRYDISNFAALKAEYRNQRRAPGQPRLHGAFLQTSFTF